jgi:molybdopterin/thiamine biosynthesis adenylyltransferase
MTESGNKGAGMTPEEKKRYFDRVQRYDRERVENLLDSKVCIVGAGAIGSALAVWLARAGVSQIVLVDGDIVEPHNLERYEGLTLRDVGKFKVHALREYILGIRPWAEVEAFPEHLGRLYRECIEKPSESGCTSFLDALEGVNLVITAVDNAWARLYATRLSMDLGVPYLEAAFSEKGEVGVFFFPDTRKGPCRLCTLQEADFTTDSLGYNMGATCPKTGACLKIYLKEPMFVTRCSGEEPEEKVELVQSEAGLFVKFRCPVCGDEHRYRHPSTPAPAVIEVARRAALEAFEAAVSFLAHGQVPEWHVLLVKTSLNPRESYREGVVIRVSESHPHECLWAVCGEK